MTTQRTQQCVLAPYEDKELLTIGAFNVGHNVTDMKTFFDSAWSDLDYLSMEEFKTVLDEKLADGNVPVIVIATTKINGAYWVPEKIEILEELVQGEMFETLYTDEWYSKEKMAERGVVQIPLCFLAKSLENMSLCHAAYFCKGWENARGCKIEHEAAKAYGLEIIYE